MSVDWRSTLRENWPYKVAALVLALLLWFNVAADDETQAQRVPTDLEVEVRDDDWVVVEAPAEVHSVFRGRRGDILAFPQNPPVIRLVIDSVTSPDMRVDLAPEMIRYPEEELSARPVSVIPEGVTIRLEPRRERRLPVVPALELSSATGFAILGSPILQPDSVTVSGAESTVESLASLSTDTISLENLRRPVTRQLGVLPPGGLDHLEIRPRTVLATVEVDSLVERQLRVPLTTRGRGAAAARIDPDSVSVRLHGPVSRVRTVSPDEVSAYVVVEDPPGEGLSLPVQVELPEGTNLTASSDPPEIQIPGNRDEG